MELAGRRAASAGRSVTGSAGGNCSGSGTLLLDHRFFVYAGGPGDEVGEQPGNEVISGIHVDDISAGGHCSGGLFECTGGGLGDEASAKAGSEVNYGTGVDGINFGGYSTVISAIHVDGISVGGHCSDGLFECTGGGLGDEVGEKAGSKFNYGTGVDSINVGGYSTVISGVHVDGTSVGGHCSDGLFECTGGGLGNEAGEKAGSEINYGTGGDGTILGGYSASLGDHATRSRPKLSKADCPGDKFTGVSIGSVQFQFYSFWVSEHSSSAGDLKGAGGPAGKSLH